MKFYCYQNIIPANTVMNTTINSKAMQLLDSIIYGVQIVFTGTPTGNFTLQASCDPAAASVGTFQKTSVNNPVNWTTISGSSQAVSSAGSVLFSGSLTQWVGYNWVRVVYTDTSGGTSTAVITVSTFNAK